MDQAARLLAGVLGIVVVGAVAAGPEQEPTKVLFDDGRIRVQELRYKPGDQGPNIPRPLRVIRVLKGGTLQRTYPDGRTERVEYKTGEVKIYEPNEPFVPRNVGKTDVVLYVVAFKEQRK